MQKGNRIMKYALTTGVSALTLAIAAPALAQDNNDSEITQTGTNGQATVTQTGSGNESDIEQDSAPIGGAPAIANIATVTQAGTDGYSSIDQTRDNTATVTQTMASRAMNSLVVQDNSSGGGNIATVTQRGFGLGKNTDEESANFTGSFVSQTGNTGNVRVQQNEGTIDAVSRITQTGTNKRAEVIQESGTADSLVMQSGGAMKVEVYQEGSSTSEIRQSGQFHTAGVRQEGDDNFSRIDQTGVNGDVGDPNEPNGAPIPTDIDERLGVWQTGDQNRSEVDQFGTNQFSDIRQNGFSNESYVTQNIVALTVPGELGADASVNQQGDDNLSRITQSGRGDIAYVDQIGNLNHSIIMQNAGGVGNEADVNQDGDDGRSRIEQSGTDNFARLNQDGLLNQSFITQGGATNQAFVNQAASGNVSAITQNGTGGLVTVNQNVPVP